MGSNNYINVIRLLAVKEKSCIDLELCWCRFAATANFVHPSDFYTAAVFLVPAETINNNI